MSAAPRPLTDRAAFEQFKAAHPELGSALKIAAIPEADFVETYGHRDGLDPRQAYRIHQTAVRVQQQTALVWANLKDMASPFLRQTLFNNIPQSFLDQQQQIPGYDRLFGSLDYIECDQSRSVLSPAAYFVDLMRFIETNITSPNTNPDPVQGIPADCRLDQRRLDLFHLRLDDDNTHTLIPYIDLVNQVLETLVTTPDQADAEAAIAEAVFPQSLPLNLPLAEIRTYLSQLDIDLPQLYDTFTTAPEAVDEVRRREQLSLSPQEFDLLGQPLVDQPDRLAAVYGFETLAEALGGLASVTTFLDRTGLSRQALSDLLFQDLDQAEVNAGLARLFFINAVEDGLGHLQIEAGAGDPDDPTRPPTETLLNLSAAKLDRVYRFLKLARRLDWSFADLDWALRSLTTPYSPERVLQFDGLNDFIQIPAPAGTEGTDQAQGGLATLQGTFTLEAWVNPARHQANPILSRGQEGNLDIHFLLCLTADGRVAFYGTASADDPPAISVQPVPVGEFTHVAVTVQTARDQSTVRLYLNGEPAQLELQDQFDQAVTLPAVQPPTGDLEVNIGRNLSDTTFAGLIKEVRVWSQGRSPAAIAENRYRRLSGFEPGLVAYWPLTESHGLELLDRTPYRQHGVPGGDHLVTQPRWVTADLVLEPLPAPIGATSYRFNGVDQYLARRGVTGLTAEQLTLEAWIYLDTPGVHPIFEVGSTGDRQSHLWFGVNEQNQLVFRSATLGDRDFSGEGAIALNSFTHVAVTVDNREVSLYLNGTLDRRHGLPANATFHIEGDDLSIGRDLRDRYVSGLIHEVRLWDYARREVDLNSFLQRPVPPLAPGLIGYWPLTDINAGQTADLSVNGNALYLGGVPADFQPTPVTVAPLRPELPVAIPGTALWFNGDRDRVVLRQDANFGLGRYPRFTLEFWFKPIPSSLHAAAPQLLFSQGDGEAGLAIYLDQQRLYGIAWCANYELTEVQETVLASAPETITDNQWHHVALVHDETQHLDYIEFRGFLDGTALGEISTTHPNTSLETGQRGHRLSPVGPAYLGNLDTTAITRLPGDYVQVADTRLHGFSGQMADLRLWERAKTAADVEAERYHDPRLFGAGLIAYLPLDEGHDVTVTDRVNGYTGQLRGESAVVMATPSVDPGLANRYTHYHPTDATSLDWTNYRYTGLLYVPDRPAAETTGGLGVTFLSRHPESIDQFYRLALTWPDGKPRFSLDAHPQGVQPLVVEQADFPSVEPDSWYAFAIQVTDDQAAEQTRMAITLWPWGQAQPDTAQVVAYDASDVRITAGTVGLWVAGQQPKTLAARFNNLQVVALDEAGEDSELLLKANFTEYLPGDSPTGWVDTADRLTPEDASDLFQPLTLNGKTVLGTDSSLTGTTAHYAPAGEDALSWSHYTYQGTLRFTETDSGIGLTVLSRTPAGLDQYYALRRDADQPTFHLVAHPLGVQPLTAEPDSSLDSGVLPEPDTDYRITLEVDAGAEATHLRAKVWVAGTLEPDDFQIKAVDSSDVRITAGTVGVWTAGPGRKTFDDLKLLQDTLLKEDFSAYGPEEDPADWGHTGAENSRQAVPELFRTAERDDAIVLGTQSQLGNIHSHYQPAEALDWSSYTYTGRMLMTSESSLGVTFFSRYTDPELGPNDNHDQYYRLRRFSGQRTFHIAPHPHSRRQVDTAGRDTGVNPVANTWYRFLIEAHDTGDRTLIRAKVWPEGSPEPADFQANTFDDNNSSNRDRRRLTAGTVGLWTAGSGEKYFDDLTVRRGLYLSADLDLEDWLPTGARHPFEPDNTLFAVERIPDHPMWHQEDDIPLLRQPLNVQALQFDGDRQYLALGSLTGDLGAGFTLEAWIQPTAIDQANPVVSWGPDTWFGLNGDGQITLVAADTRLSGDTSLPTDGFTHVAIAVADDRATLYVNGVMEAEAPVPAVELIATAATEGGSEEGLEVGRAGAQYFGGQIRDLRLWSALRSDFPTHQRYQTPDLTADSLLAYWPFADFEQAYSLDTSAQANHLRLGGLEPARRPTLVSRDRANDDYLWQQPLTSLTFATPQDGLTIPAIATPPQRYTVELWVKVSDPTLSQRKQVIYHSGDGQQGLVIYIHDGRLYGGGYDQPAGWQGTWLSSDRILAERWHHVALVLDGRPELRPQTLRAYLDGKLVGVGDGQQLSAEVTSHLGIAAADVQFHDGPASGLDTYLVGAVLELRLWTTARTTAEIRTNRYGTLGGDQPHLALWWRFDDITAENPDIADGSGQGHSLELADLDRLQPLAPLPLGNPPTLALTPATLFELATFQQLMQRHRQPVERLTALWHDLRHTGRADGRVFFDQVFNPTAMGITPWRYHDPARRWDVTSQELPSRDRAIRSRLMGALQVSSDDLDALVALLSGAETTIALDTPYLRQLYRLSQTPRALGLSLREYRLLLERVGLSRVESLGDLAQLSDRITELRRIGLSIDDLNFFAYDIASDRVRTPYTQATIRDLADDLANQSIEFLVTPITFVSDQISEFESGEIVDFFRPSGDDITVGALTRRYFVDDLGAVSDRYQMPADLKELAIAQGWAAPFTALPAEAFSALQTTGFVNEYGIILRSDDLDDFPAAFGDTPPNPTVLAEIQAVLENQNNRQSAITETLVRYRDEHRSAILAGLSDLLGVEPAPLQAVIDHFQSVNQPLSDRARLLERLITIADLDEDQPIPADLQDYLFDLFKILLLVTRFELTTAEIRTLLTHPACFSVSDVFRPNLTDLTHLFTFTELKTAFGDEADQLLELLRLKPESPLVNEAILQLSGWDLPQLLQLQRHFGQRPYNRVENLILLRRGFALAAQLRVDIGFLLQLAATDDLSLGFYRQQADALLPVLRGLYDDEQWPRVYRPLRDPLAIQKRDALLALAMDDIPADFEGRRSPDLLSEYLLLDVQVSSAVETSHIVQGTAALQQYVQRCLMNLEKGVDPATIPTDQWEWMQNYRVWEANRKVFLYPESFIEPELRRDKTPLFEELEQSLMQAEINQIAVTQAYTHYLNQFMKLANLKIVGSYHHKPLEDGENASQDDILFLVGRTQSQPAQFYYRELVNGTQWRPWQEIDLVIDADHISPVYAFGRLFLFWAELTELSEPMDVGPVRILPEGENNREAQTLEGDGITQRDIEDYRAGRRSLDAQGFLLNDNIGERVQRNVDVFRPTVKYSYLDADQTWIAPQTYLELDEDLRAEEAILPIWQRVAVERVLNPNQDNLVPTETNVRVLELNSNTVLLHQIPQFDMRRLTWSFWVNLANQQRTGFLAGEDNTPPVSPTVLLFEYDLNLAATARANIAEIPRLRQAVQQSLRLASDLPDPIRRLRQGDETERTAAEAALQRSLNQLRQAQSQASNTPNPDLSEQVNRLTIAIGNVTFLTESYLEDPNDTTARSALEAVLALTDVAETTPQWQTTSWKLRFSRSINSQTGFFEIDLDYDTWHHIALTLEYQQSTNDYELRLYVGSGQGEGEAAASSLRQTGRLSGRLPSGSFISIGLPSSQAFRNIVLGLFDQSLLIRETLSPFFTAYLSEFRLWDQVRDLETINTSKNNRLSGQEPGVVYFPLNRPPRGNFVFFGEEYRDQIAALNTLVFSDRLRAPSLEFGLSSILPIDFNRERILLFYGNQVRSIRNNLEEQSFALRLENRLEDVDNYDISLSLFNSNSGFLDSRGLILHLAVARGLSLNDYGNGEPIELNRLAPESLRRLLEQSNSLVLASRARQLSSIRQVVSENTSARFVNENVMLRDLPRYEAAIMDVGNQPGWYILNTGDEQFLIQAEIDNLKTVSERLRFEYAQGETGDVRQHIVVYFDRDPALEVTRRGSDDAETTNLPPNFRFSRLTTFAVHDLSVKLFTQGIDGLLSLTAQNTEELDFGSYRPFEHNPDSQQGLVLASDIPDRLDFDGAYGLYYREIFFHIPFFIANQLNANQNFADAQRWYHYIFNPTSSEAGGQGGENGDRYWQYLPFRDPNLMSLRAILGNEAALAEYRENPFDPHAIARLRMVAYQKAIVMKYIDNLLDWADHLFAQDNRESINQAFLLYVLAFNLLGPRPEARASRQFEDIGNYQGIHEAFEQTPEFLTDLDLNGNVAARTSTITLNQNGNIITTFCIPENADFIGFWDRVEDRLFKIRHSLNIEGVFRQLALFQPPLDVRALVQAFAAGGRDIGSLLADVNLPVPHYRYDFMLNQAKEMIGTVRDFGSALLDALEKRDAEQLTMLQNTHERNLLDLTTAVREATVDTARETIEMLGISRQRILNRRDYFQALIDGGLNSEENAELALMGISQGIRSIASPHAVLAGIIKSLPRTEAGMIAPLPKLTTSVGADELSALIEAGVKLAEITADTIDTAAEMTAKVGEYKRRENEWRLELRTSEFDLEDINQQIEIAQIQLQMAERERDIHNRQIEQNREIATFHRRKFGNEALYNWMVSRLAGFYFQAYKLAYDFAKSAERALQYELPTNQRFIHFGHWDSLRRGLLAGEALLLDVNRMEKFHLDNDSRFLEIEKTIPLSQVDDVALAQLLATGECEFRLGEALFNRDYPGHYFRVIRTIALTLIFPDGDNLAQDPYLTVNASLTQVGNKTLLEPDIDAVRYLMGRDGAGQPSGSTLRVNWRSNQQIAVSKPQLDNGLFLGFNLNLAFEDRYLPFEGTGAVSQWQLAIPLETNPRLRNANNTLAIADVMIHIRYTAKADQGQFKTQVQEEMRE
jgi:hypothetical protein